MNVVIGLKIKELRKEKKLTQKAFSTQINIDDSQLSKIEQGKLMPTLSQLLEISSIYKVSLDWLVGKEVINTSSSQPQENDNNEIVSLLKDKISLLEKNNALLEKENAYQAKEILLLEKEVSNLKKQTKSPTPAKVLQSQGV